MHKNLLVLAAGVSSRMKNSAAVHGLSSSDIRTANSQNKALITFGLQQRPILDHVLIHAEKAGYTNIYLIVGENAAHFKAYYGTKPHNNTFRNLTISYATQHIPEGREKPFGTADAVFQALEQYPKLQHSTFTVCNGDNLYSVRALQMVLQNKAQNACIAYNRETLEYSAARIARFAIIKLSTNNMVVDIVEKPETIEPLKDRQGRLFVSMNIFKLYGENIYEYLQNCPVHPIRNEKELPTAIVKYCKDYPNTLQAIPLEEHVPDLTSKEDISVFRKYLKNLNE